MIVSFSFKFVFSIFCSEISEVFWHPFFSSPCPTVYNRTRIFLTHLKYVQAHYMKIYISICSGSNKGNSWENYFSFNLVIQHLISRSLLLTFLPFQTWPPGLYTALYGCGPFTMVAVVRMGVRRRDSKLAWQVPQNTCKTLWPIRRSGS